MFDEEMNRKIPDIAERVAKILKEEKSDDKKEEKVEKEIEMKEENK